MFSGILIGGWEIILLLVVLPVMLALLAFWVWMLVDCIRNPRLTDQQRLIWVPVIVFTHWLGALIYLLAGRNPRTGWRPPRRTGIFHSPALISAHESLRRSP